MKIRFFCGVIAFFVQATYLVAQSQVVPCQLSNPDQDTLRLFPERTNYRTEFMRTDEVENARHLKPKELYRDLEKRLGDSWDPVWETSDIPYVFYEILKGQEKIGWVFGANQGWPGADNAQLMLGFDLEERIREFYYQKLPSFESSVLRNEHFYSQFIGLSLEQFYVHERLFDLKIQDPDILSLDMIQRIQDPTKNEREGFQKTLRGIKKILVYLDDFKFQNRIKKEEVFKNIDYIIKNKNTLSFLPKHTLFQDASRYVVDLVSVEKNREVLEKRLGGSFGAPLVYPVYTFYKDDVYQDPFVRGILLGYAVPMHVGSFVGLVCVGAGEENKGKILSLEVNSVDFPQFKGLSLVHFYTKDFLVKNNMQDALLDRIASIVNLTVEGKDQSKDIQDMAKKALILVDENYFHNFFNKEEIMKKIQEYKSV